MNKPSDEHKSYANHHPGSFLAGMLLGGLAGAGAALLLAPQSGEKTRAQIEQKSMELRDQTTEAVEDAVAQTRVKARQVTADVRTQVEALQQRGQAVLDEQKARVSTLLKAGKQTQPGD
jgi:gas vesicle protein